MRTATLAVVSLFALALPARAPCSSLSCSCQGPRDPAAAYRAAEAVFAGRATWIRLGPHGLPLVSIRVTQVWKGHLPDSLEIVGSLNGNDCRYRFRRGRAYLVYAWPSTTELGILTTGSCSRTGPLDSVGVDLAFLRGLAKP
jgi:hypothetical protein